MSELDPSGYPLAPDTLPVLLGAYRTWVQLMAGTTVWADYLKRGGTVEGWRLHNHQQDLRHQEELKRRWEEHQRQLEAARSSRRSF